MPHTSDLRHRNLPSSLPSRTLRAHEHVTLQYHHSLVKRFKIFRCNDTSCRWKICAGWEKSLSKTEVVGEEEEDEEEDEEEETCMRDSNLGVMIKVF